MSSSSDWMAWPRPWKTALPALLNSDRARAEVSFSQQTARPPSLIFASTSFRGLWERLNASRVSALHAPRGLLSMKLFRCQVCDNIIYFENRTCGRCGHRLGYVPELEVMAALEPAGGKSWTPLEGDSGPRRFCANADYDVCNWLTPAEGQDRLCVACRHNDTIPEFLKPRISQPGGTSNSPSTAVLQSASLEAAARDPRRGPEPRAGVRIPGRSSPSFRSKGDDRARRWRGDDRACRGRQRGDREAPGGIGRALSQPARPFPARGRASLLGYAGSRRRQARAMPRRIRRRYGGL